MITIIRSAAAEDAGAIARVHVASWQTAYRGILPAGYLASLSENERTSGWERLLSKQDQFTFVAESDGEVVGFAIGGPAREGRHLFEGELYAIYLLSEFRGQGIGRKLFQQAAETLLQRGMDGMLVWVLEKNPYRSFYERLGGELVSQQMIEMGGKPFDEVAYRWRNLRQTVEAGQNG